MSNVTQTQAAQKAQIIADLQAVALLKSVIPVENVKNWDIFALIATNGLPAIIVPPPSAETSRKQDSTFNDRTNSFEMALVIDLNALSGGDSGYDVETITQAVLDAFDNDQTLNGNSFPSLEPSVMKSFDLTDATKSWQVVPITVKAHAQIFSQLPT